MNIVKFPIEVITTKATEETYGITPQLRDSVRAVAAASTEAVVSERGISAALGELEWTATGSSLEDLALFNNIDNTGHLYYYFNSIACSDWMEIAEDDQNIYINSKVPGAPGSSVDVSEVRTLNGGIEQEASKVNYSNFDATTGVAEGDGFPIFKDFNNEWALGKILLKCTEPFNDTTTKFTIGTATEKNAFAESFAVSGYAAGDLINFDYGTWQHDKITWGGEIKGGGAPEPSPGRYTETNVNFSTSTGWNTFLTSCPEGTVAEVLIENTDRVAPHIAGVRNILSSALRYIEVPRGDKLTDVKWAGSSGYRTYVNVGAGGAAQYYASNTAIKIRVVGYWEDVTYTESAPTPFYLGVTNTWTEHNVSDHIHDITMTNQNSLTAIKGGIRTYLSRLHRVVHLSPNTGVISMLAESTQNPTTLQHSIELFSSNNNNILFWKLGTFEKSTVRFHEKYGKFEVEDVLAAADEIINIKPYLEVEGLVEILCADMMVLTSKSGAETYINQSERGFEIGMNNNPTANPKCRDGYSIGNTISETETVTLNLKGGGSGATATDFEIHIMGYFK